MIISCLNLCDLFDFAIGTELDFEESMGARNLVGIGLSNRPARAGIFKEAMGARNRGGRGLLYRPARLHRLAEFIPWNRFRGPIHV